MDKRNSQYGSALCAAIALLWGTGAPCAPAAEGNAPTSSDCQADTPAVRDARAALESEPSTLDSRLKIANGLIDQRCYEEAVTVLEAAAALHPNNSTLQKRLRYARSLVNEQNYVENLGQAEQSARQQRNVLRCGKLGDIAACDEALSVTPNNTDLLLAKADALIRDDRPTEAILLYRRTVQIDPANATAQARAAAAESQREALITVCRNDNDENALQACKRALMHRVEDEFDLQKRTAMLLQSMNRPVEALDAYIAASLLKPNDKQIAQAVVALTENTKRKDAFALATRGTALLTVGRGTEAVKTLRDAKALAPDFPELSVKIATAEKLAAAERTALARQTASVRLAAAEARASALPAPIYSNSEPVGASH